MIYRLSFRDASRASGGAVVPGQLERATASGGWDAGPAALDDLRRERRLVFLLHGFNVNLQEGRVSLARLARALPRNADAGLVCALWPGDHSAGALSYPFEGDDADDTAEAMARYVTTWIAPTVPLSFVAHSLGCRVTLQVNDRLQRGGREVDQVCLFAPAVDDDGLAHVEKWRASAGSVRRLAVLHSTSDRVLRFAYPVGDWLRAVFTLWRDDPGLALGYGGPRAAGSEPGGVPANVMHQPVGGAGVDHGDYLPPSELDVVLNPKQQGAARYADDFLTGAPASYPVGDLAPD